MPELGDTECTSWHDIVGGVTLSAPRGMTLLGEEENNYYVFGENLGNG